jgi:hypothetical protein
MQEDRHVEWPDRGRLSTVHCLNTRAETRKCRGIQNSLREV